ncbi:ClpXP protease specificity-enhancing factor [Roseateles sp.]|jgi:stringent starvation protein B|uniref:ClpXP protease specificity-enhancing factor n=1 Tax=Roseateles sp. TaxID=1971397 RepID=UPI0037CAA4BF
MDQSSEGGSTVGASGTSTRPYLIRALHDWCTDNGFTPYIAVHVDRFVQVPNEYVSNNEIVLNVGFDATSGLELGNEFIQFKARFGGVAREIVVPIDHVVAIYARENGQGMAFPAPGAERRGSVAAVPAAAADPSEKPSGKPVVSPARGGLRLATGPAEGAAAESSPDLVLPATDDDDPAGPGAGGGRPSLKRVK